MTVQLWMHLLFWSFSFLRDSTTNVVTYTIDTESFIRYISIVWTYIIFISRLQNIYAPLVLFLVSKRRVSRYIYCTRSHLLILNGLTRILPRKKCYVVYKNRFRMIITGENCTAYLLPYYSRSDYPDGFVKTVQKNRAYILKAKF